MTNALDEDNYWEPCDAKPKSSGHGQYGFCQAGTSTAVDAVSGTVTIVFFRFSGIIVYCGCLHCFDAVGWATGRASGF